MYDVLCLTRELIRVQSHTKKKKLMLCSKERLEDRWVRVWNDTMRKKEVQIREERG